MIKNVTDQDVFEYIVGYTLENGYQPSRKSIWTGLGICREAFEARMRSLKMKGSVKVIPGKTRAYEIPYLVNLLDGARETFRENISAQKQ